MKAGWGAALLVGLAAGVQAEEFDCLIEPKLTVSVGTPVEGVIDKVHVERGDSVERHQVLIELESSVERANVAMARARADAEGSLQRNDVMLRFAERDLARREELSLTGVISVNELDEAQSNKEIAAAGLREAKEAKQLARLDLKRSQAALGLRTIRSTVDGVVIKRHFSPGEYADTRPILDLAQIDPLHVEVFVPVSMFGRIPLGMRAQVMPEQPVGGSYEASVTVVDPVIDAASGTFGVRLELPNPDSALPAGLNCRVRFPTEEVKLSATPEGLEAE